MEVRDGLQSAVEQKALEKETPMAARRSMFGVCSSTPKSVRIVST